MSTITTGRTTGAIGALMLLTIAASAVGRSDEDATRLGVGAGSEQAAYQTFAQILAI